MGRDIEKMRVRRARKHYDCDECRRHAAIKPGERYMYLFGVLDDLPVSARFCGKCCASEFHQGGRVGNTWAAALA